MASCSLSAFVEVSPDKNPILFLEGRWQCSDVVFS
jgi:hypothetical protein